MTFVQKQLSLWTQAPVACLFSCEVWLRERAREVWC